ncbi:Phr family secreted Rap phosphatase inhibitor [Bacillus sp. DX4.1]|nr:Phr family secreted Rap phosphatase inhibitor [Bacillus sp. DX4.1]MDM5187427.1 Phr family secreted Rap phosphatase inhibitor [Bacillus sp. DX4.1]
MKRIITSSIGLIMTVVLLSGVNVSTDQQKDSTTNVIQYTHGEPWG